MAGWEGSCATGAHRCLCAFCLSGNAIFHLLVAAHMHVHVWFPPPWRDNTWHMESKASAWRGAEGWGGPSCQMVSTSPAQNSQPSRWPPIGSVIRDLCSHPLAGSHASLYFLPHNRQLEYYNAILGKTRAQASAWSVESVRLHEFLYVREQIPWKCVCPTTTLPSTFIVLLQEMSSFCCAQTIVHSGKIAWYLFAMSHNSSNKNLSFSCLRTAWRKRWACRDFKDKNLRYTRIKSGTVMKFSL